MPPVTADAASKLPDLSGDVIPVLVGKKTFKVHETVLTDTSKFFQNATKPEWRTDPTKPIDLSDQKEVLFARYVQWLYRKTLKDYKSKNKDLEELARLYVLGEAIMDAKFQEVIIMTIIDVYSHGQETMSLLMVRIIYEGTAAGSPARDLLSDICAFQLKPSFKRVKNLDIEKDSEFMKDLIVALLTHRPRPSTDCDEKPWVMDLDRYSVLRAEGSITEESPVKDETDTS